MTTYQDSRPFTAGADLEAHRRVKIDTSVTSTPTVIYAQATEDCIGVTEYSANQGDIVSVKLKDHDETFEVECVVTTAIAIGTVLYAAADGKVGDDSNSGANPAQGINLETPTVVSGAVIEMLFTA